MLEHCAVYFVFCTYNLFIVCTVNIKCYLASSMFVTSQYEVDSLTTLCTWFERVTMLVIFINCVTLGMYQPCEDTKCVSSRCRLLEVSPLTSL